MDVKGGRGVSVNSTQVGSPLQDQNPGGQDELARVMAEHSAFVRGVCGRAMWAYPSLVDDAVQTVFIIVARKMNQLPSSSVLLTGWLHRCSVNVCRNMSRAETSRLGVVRRVQEESRQVGEETQNSDRDWDDVAKQLDEVLQELPERQRNAILRHHLQGIDCRSIAVDFGTSESAVKMLLRRGRATLQRKLSRRGIVVSLAVLVTGLEAGAGELPIGDFRLPIGENAGVPEGIRNTADAVMAEMDRTATKAMWGWIGVGTALVVSHLQSVPAVPAVSWRIESVIGAVMVRRSDATLAVKTGDALCFGDTILTSSNQEVQVTSDGGSRILVREEGDVRFEHPTLNTEHRTSKSGEGDSQVRVVCGAIVAELKSPVHFATAHAVIQSDAGSFFLMVASGTNSSVPWSFSRLDVTGGQVLFRSSGTQVSSSEFPLSRFQFAAAGTDHEGKSIETVARKSDGREMSPKYEGVFFRECATVYESGRLVWDVTPRVNKGQKRTLSPAEIMRTARCSAGVEKSLVSDKGRDSVLFKPVSDTNRVMVVSPFRSAGMYAFEFELCFRTDRLDIEFEGMTKMFRSSTPNLDRQESKGIDKGVWYPLEYEEIQVGNTTDGLQVMEDRVSFDGQAVAAAWYVGNATGPILKFIGDGFLISGVSLRAEGVDVGGL